MTEQKPDFLPPDPDTRVSEIAPDRLQEWAVTAGKTILDQVDRPDMLSPEQAQKDYDRLKKSIAETTVTQGEFVTKSTNPLRFEVMIPITFDEQGRETPRNTWHFAPHQYLGSLSKGVYPISNFGEGLMYHDTLHAAELSVIQRYCPGVGQLMIDVASHALQTDPETQNKITELIDYFTDTFTLDQFSIPIFEWRASDLFRIVDSNLSKKDSDQRARGLALEAVSGLRRYMTEQSQALT